MNKEKIFHSIKVLNMLPLLGVGLILLVGSGYTLLGIFENFYFRLMVVGYVIALVFGLLSFKKDNFLFLSILGWAIFGWATFMDSKQMIEANNELCLELRANPTCVEDECGFDCEDVGGGIGLTTSGSICKDKDMSICQEKREQESKDENDTQDALDVYSSIVDKIIASPSPASEDFQNEFVAIYNCLERIYGPGAEGELRATQVLKEKNLTAEQLEKYYSYHSSKGRNFTPGRIIAGLPNGDKNLSCEYIDVE